MSSGGKGATCHPSINSAAVCLCREICSVFAHQIQRQPFEILDAERRGTKSILDKVSYC